MRALKRDRSHIRAAAALKRDAIVTKNSPHSSAVPRSKIPHVSGTPTAVLLLHDSWCCVWHGAALKRDRSHISAAAALKRDTIE